MAAALDAGAISPSDLFLDDNKLKVYDATISNADREWWPNGHGLITPAEVLALSNNVGAATIGLTLGGERLYDALVRFGFGRRPGSTSRARRRASCFIPTTRARRRR